MVLQDASGNDLALNYYSTTGTLATGVTSGTYYVKIYSQAVQLVMQGFIQSRTYTLVHIIMRLKEITVGSSKRTYIWHSDYRKSCGRQFNRG